MTIVLTILAQAVSLAANNYAVDVPMRTPATRPAFADEFTGAIDQRRWRYDTDRNRQGWANHEAQYYVSDRHDNARIEHGALVIEARSEALRSEADWGGQKYSSAKLVSRAAFGYGFYEIRARLPCGRGTWPAIWLLPQSGSWPDMGEIDVMEMVGWQPLVVHATVHSAAFNHLRGTQRGAETRVASACTAYHRYQLDWQPHAITIGMDGHGYMRVTDDEPGGHAAWPFTVPYNLILNLAVGGDWGGAKGIDDAALPQRMSVDYVRYWRAA
uniref:glycoside hydrolase family 16 protein n=1 Tax=uncultured Sphingomonas sp. TaxID=158754 RepID=UPI0035C95A90